MRHAFPLVIQFLDAQGPMGAERQPPKRHALRGAISALCTRRFGSPMCATSRKGLGHLYWSTTAENGIAKGLLWCLYASRRYSCLRRVLLGNTRRTARVTSICG
jgi:hypothetical protein